jgi:hypothetical protein
VNIDPAGDKRLEMAKNSDMIALRICITADSLLFAIRVPIQCTCPEATQDVT